MDFLKLTLFLLFLNLFSNYYVTARILECTQEGPECERCNEFGFQFSNTPSVLASGIDGPRFYQEQDIFQTMNEGLWESCMIAWRDFRGQQPLFWTGFFLTDSKVPVSDSKEDKDFFKYTAIHPNKFLQIINGQFYTDFAHEGYDVKFFKACMDVSWDPMMLYWGNWSKTYLYSAVKHLGMAERGIDVAINLFQPDAVDIWKTKVFWTTELPALVKMCASETDFERTNLENNSAPKIRSTGEIKPRRTISLDNLPSFDTIETVSRYGEPLDTKHSYKLTHLSPKGISLFWDNEKCKNARSFKTMRIWANYGHGEKYKKEIELAYPDLFDITVYDCGPKKCIGAEAMLLHHFGPRKIEDFGGQNKCGCNCKNQ